MSTGEVSTLAEVALSVEKWLSTGEIPDIEE